MPDVHRIGFTQLLGDTGAEGGPYRLNIIFIHGLRGHPKHTWESDRAALGDQDNSTSSKSTRPSLVNSFFQKSSSASDAESQRPASELSTAKLFWLDDYLTKDIPNARVWTYGYNADVIGGLFQANNQNSMSQHGRDFAVKLEREIDNEDPIIFVAHSLGGIIVKDAMHRSAICRQRTKLIVFLGTPHRGSSYSAWGQIAENFALLAAQDSNKKLLEVLEVNSEVLDNIHDEFKTTVYQTGLKVHSFQEARGISGMKGFHNKVVDDFSSKLDLPQSLETVETIDANHMQMARCASRDDMRYRAIAGVLKQFIRSILPDSHSTMAREIPSEIPPPQEIELAVQSQNPDSGPSKRTTLPCHIIPLRSNRKFVGRKSILYKLKRMLFEQKCPIVAIFGLGGVGKTQVALHIAHWTQAYKPDYSVFWVPAISTASFEQAYVEMAKSLPIRKLRDDEDPKEAVQRYLSSKEAGPWLMILDNADDMGLLFGNSDIDKGIRDYLPESDNSLILITTRFRDVALTTAGNDMVELHQMDKLEAMSFLKNSLTQQDLLCDDAIIAKLLEELSYLPLAITQAVAYINRNQTTILKYLDLLHGTEQDLVDLMSTEFRDNTRYASSQNAVATTWLVSFDQIRSSDSAVAELLSFMSYIEPKAIPQSILPWSGSEAKMTEAIGTLCAYSFLVRRENRQVFDMHSLVHLATRIWVQKRGIRTETIQKAIQHLAATFPSDDYTNRVIWQEYMPHALKALQLTERVIGIAERDSLCYWVGRCFRVDGRAREAVKYLEDCYEWREQALSKDDPNRLYAQHALATAYEADGQVKKAIILLEQVVQIEERIFSEEHPDRLTSQHELARAYRADGQVKKAVILLKQVVQIRERTLSEKHPDRLASQHALAMAYRADGQVKKAVILLEQVVQIEERTLSEEHPDRLTSQHELAGAYKADGQVKKAVNIFEQVVQIRERTLSEEHPDRLASQHALAMAYKTDGQVKKAIILLEQVVQINERTLSEEHPNRLTSQHTLAMAYETDGQIQKAIALLEQVVQINERTLSEEHPNRLTSQHALAMAYETDGQVQKAIALLKEVVRIREKTLDQTHPYRVGSEEELARLVGDYYV